MQERERVFTRAWTWTSRATLALGLLLLASSAPALAENAIPETDSGVQRDESSAFAAGIVLAVDAAHGQLALEEASLSGETFTFLVQEDTHLEKDGDTIDLASIAVGDPVSVEYRTGPSGEKLAGSVEVLTAPAESTGSR